MKGESGYLTYQNDPYARMVKVLATNTRERKYRTSIHLKRVFFEDYTQPSVYGCVAEQDRERKWSTFTTYQIFSLPMGFTAQLKLDLMINDQPRFASLSRAIERSR